MLVAQAVSPAARQAADPLGGAPRAVAVPDYFPLSPGNVWIYRGAGARAESILTIEVGTWEVFQGRAYFRLQVSPNGDYWVRMTEDGSLVAFDPDRKAEQVWYNFQVPAGQPYATFLPGVCCGQAVVQSRSAEYRGPIGEFDRALEMRYPGVFQVGLEKELFLPYVGMVHRSIATGGPSMSSYDLIYARLGGVTVISARELAFSLSLDNSIYYANFMPPIDPGRVAPVLRARLTLRNTADSVQLTFPSGQTFDFLIKNEKGDVIYRWSDGKAFTLVFRTGTLGPGEMNYVVETRLADKDGKPWPQGRYIAEGWLTTMGPRAYLASVAFELRYVH